MKCRDVNHICCLMQERFQQFSLSLASLLQALKYLARIFHADRDEETVKTDGVPPAAQETAGGLPLGRPSKGETSFAKRVNADGHFDTGLYVYSPFHVKM